MITTNERGIEKRVYTVCLYGMSVHVVLIKDKTTVCFFKKNKQKQKIPNTKQPFS